MKRGMFPSPYGRSSSAAQRGASLNASPGYRCHSAARGCGSDVFELVRVARSKQAFLFGVVPIGKCRAVNPESERLVSGIDGVGANHRDALRDYGFVLIRGAASSIIRGKFGKIGADDRKHKMSARVQNHHPFG